MKKLLLLLAFTPILASAQERFSLNGEWRGQAQYYATLGGVPDASAHAVTNLTIALEPAGKVVGVSSENGCRMLGVAVPGAAPTIVTLDVTLSQCQYAGLNRRFNGTLAYYSKDSAVVLYLSSVQVSAGKAASFEVKATMRC